MKLIYRIYQLFVVLPFLIFSSIACALVTTIGCTLGDGHYWGTSAQGPELRLCQQPPGIV